jgi:hypothetical protein
MKFYYLENEIEKEFEAPIHGRVTSKLKEDFITKLGELEQDKLYSEQIEALAGHTGKDTDPSSLVSLLKFNQLQRVAPDINTVIHNDSVYIDLVKIIVDTRKLEKTYKDLLETANNSEFWNLQDMNNIIDTVVSFRGGLKI